MVKCCHLEVNSHLSERPNEEDGEKSEYEFNIKLLHGKI